MVHSSALVKGDSFDSIYAKFEYTIDWLYTDHIVYGTVCAVSALMMSVVLGVVCTSVYIKCKHKGDVYIFALHHQMVYILLLESTQPGLEQNSAYEGINTGVHTLPL